MALFYTGYRPILRGQSDSDWVNTFTGKVGVYSNWQLMSRHQALEGMPNINHVPGTGYSPHDLFLSRKFRGLDTQEPMDNPGLGPRVKYGPLATDGGRYHPWEFKGIASARVFQASSGHVAFRNVPYAFFVNWFYHGVPADQAMLNPGHRFRGAAPGASVDIKDGAGLPAASFGRFDPWRFHGVPSAVEVQNPGQPATSGIYNNAFLDRDHKLGHNRVNEWIGVTAANALGTGAGRHHRGNH